MWAQSRRTHDQVIGRERESVCVCSTLVDKLIIMNSFFVPTEQFLHSFFLAEKNSVTRNLPGTHPSIRRMSSVFWSFACSSSYGCGRRCAKKKPSRVIIHKWRQIPFCPKWQIEKWSRNFIRIKGGWGGGGRGGGDIYHARIISNVVIRISKSCL